MKTDDVTLSAFELYALTSVGVDVLKTTEGGVKVLFYPPDTEPEHVQSAFAIPMSDFIARELREGGSSGYTRGDLPFISLGIRLVG
jgi:hypothetical protein